LSYSHRLWRFHPDETQEIDEPEPMIPLGGTATSVVGGLFSVVPAEPPPDVPVAELPEEPLAELPDVPGAGAVGAVVVEPGVLPVVLPGVVVVGVVIPDVVLSVVDPLPVATPSYCVGCVPWMKRSFSTALAGVAGVASRPVRLSMVA
jgi:hypothetical protein